MKNFALFINEDKDKNLKHTKTVLDFLSRENYSCYARGLGIRPIELNCPVLDKESAKLCDAAIVLGGDGTMLKAIKFFDEIQIPFLGINLGTLGFLTDVKMNEIEKRLTDLTSGNYSIDKRAMIRLYRGRKPLGDALNEVMAKHIFGAGTGEFKVYSDNVLLGDYSADGILVVAPTGSTAYSLSAGGPIVNPKCAIMLIQPIAPHSLNNRCIIVNAQETVKLVFRPRTTNVCIDGEVVKNTGNKVEIKLSPRTVSFIKFSDYNFYELVFDKFKNITNVRG